MPEAVRLPKHVATVILPLSYPGRVGRPDLALAPQPGQFGEKTFKAFPRWRFPHFWGSRCYQGRLGLTDGMQQQHRIQSGPVSFSAALISSLVSSCWISRSQGVVG